MPRQSTPIEFNKFIAGLVTDASPLTSVPNSSLEEINYVLNIDGSRNRRLGLDYEENFQEIVTTVNGDSNENIAFTSYKWKNAGGVPDKTLSVIQVGNEIKVFDLSSQPITSNLIYTYKFISADITQNFSYAVVDGILVISTGAPQPSTFSYDTDTGTISKADVTLYIRDFFGVEDIVNGLDLYDGVNVQQRLPTTTQNHIYNLRNQTFGIPRHDRTLGVLFDPIETLHIAAFAFPANSDNVNESLYPDPEYVPNRTLEMFWGENAYKNPLGTNRAPQGYYIIDALSRGASRLAKNQANNVAYPQLFAYQVSTLPEDRTPGGPTVIAEFAGRIFYGGFSGEVIGGDKLSPRMSSYILFSKNVSNLNDIGSCFQEGDPTSKTTPDLIDTDGGFLRLNGAFGIKAMINVGSSLIILATNGVWRVLGGSDYGFSATNFLVEKISDHGISSSDSVVLVDNTIMFWGTDAIYHVHTDQFGGWVCENISFGRIQNLFDSIPFEDRVTTRGSYDTFDRKVRWLYYNRINDTALNKELVLDVSLKAYYNNEIKQLDTVVPRVVGYLTTEPYVVEFNTEGVSIASVPVTIGINPVTIEVETRVNSITREIGYIVITQTVPVVKYTFGMYRNTRFLDWFSADGVGVDAEAFMVTSYISNTSVEDFQRNKSVPYIHIHMNRTETGFEEDADGDFVPVNASSCIVQARWEWANSANSNRWSRPFQAYRYKKHYFPVDVDDPFDNGFDTIVTRNRLRGSGKVLSLKFSTEAGKDCHIYGWSMIFSMAGNV